MIKKCVEANNDLNLVLWQIRVTTTATGISSPTTILFNRPIYIKNYVCINRSPVNNNCDDWCHKMLKNH